MKPFHEPTEQEREQRKSLIGISIGVVIFAAGLAWQSVSGSGEPRAAIVPTTPTAQATRPTSAPDVNDARPRLTVPALTVAEPNGASTGTLDAGTAYTVVARYGVSYTRISVNGRDYWIVGELQPGVAAPDVAPTPAPEPTPRPQVVHAPPFMYTCVVSGHSASSTASEADACAAALAAWEATR